MTRTEKMPRKARLYASGSPHHVIGRGLRRGGLFYNKFYPHWVFETPDTHASGFRVQRPFSYRVARYLVNMVKRVCKGHLIYLAVSLAYAAGFIKGYVCYKDDTQA